MIAASLDALDEHHDEKIDRRPYARTENLSALCVNLAKLLEGRGKFVLVLDAVDKLRESAGTLIAALGRLGESVRPYDIFNQHWNISNPPTDTQPLPHPHNDPPPSTLDSTLREHALTAVPHLHPHPALLHPQQRPAQNFRHTAFRRPVPRLYPRPRRRRRCLALVALHLCRVRQPQ